MNDKTQQELVTIEEAWNRAIVSNDSEAISRFIADEWVLVGAAGQVIERAMFLEVVKSGDLTHTLMEADEWRVRVYGDTAVVTARVRSGGEWKGDAFLTNERSTSVYVKQEGQWVCVLTQLTAIRSG